MTPLATRSFYVGESASIREQIDEALGLESLRGLPEDLQRGDTVFIEVDAGREVLGTLPGGNAFSACRFLKDRHLVRVYLLIEEGDDVSAEIGRFCLADGSLERHADGLVKGAEGVRARLAPHKPRVSVDSLLARLETEISSNEGRQVSALQRMLAEGEKPSFLAKLVDAETGLFDGAYISFRLDEEFKRAMRLHQPLSLLLLEIGGDSADTTMAVDDCGERLAEIAAVFLNECRDIDIIGRFTATTFMVLMPGTGSAGAEIVAHRMLKQVKTRGGMNSLGGTPYAGLVTIPSAGIGDRQEFLARAESCLSAAQQGGGCDGFFASSE